MAWRVTSNKYIVTAACFLWRGLPWGKLTCPEDTKHPRRGNRVQRQNKFFFLSWPRALLVQEDGFRPPRAWPMGGQGPWVRCPKAHTVVMKTQVSAKRAPQCHRWGASSTPASRGSVCREVTCRWGSWGSPPQGFAEHIPRPEGGHGGRAEHVSPAPLPPSLPRCPAVHAPGLPVTHSDIPRAGSGHQTHQGYLAPSWEQPPVGTLESSHRLSTSQPRQGPAKMSWAHTSEPAPASCTRGPSGHGGALSSEGSPPGLLICFHGLEILSDSEPRGLAG